LVKGTSVLFHVITLCGRKPAPFEKHRKSMPVVALAYHENVAVEKLNRYFAAAAASGGDSRATTCSKCSLAFAVVLVNRANKSNARYLGELQAVIEKDCVSGYHRGEYTLTVTSTSED
jgi:hypothetical protein